MEPILVVRQDKALIVKGRDVAAQVRPSQQVRRVVRNEADVAKWERLSSAESTRFH
jgi:hypothetical protein